MGAFTGGIKLAIEKYKELGDGAVWLFTAGRDHGHTAACGFDCPFFEATRVALASSCGGFFPCRYLSGLNF